jgi:hypothetical protein
VGPGTHIVERVNAKIMPTSRTDFIALTHDINYLLASGDHKAMDLADDRAIFYADRSTYGIIMDIGLKVRKAIHLKEGKVNTYALGSQLRDKVRNDKDYTQLAAWFDLDLNDLFI